VSRSFFKTVHTMQVELIMLLFVVKGFFLQFFPSQFTLFKCALSCRRPLQSFEPLLWLVCEQVRIAFGMQTCLAILAILGEVIAIWGSAICFRVTHYCRKYDGFASGQVTWNSFDTTNVCLSRESKHMMKPAIQRTMQAIQHVMKASVRRSWLIDRSF
jgi:hypothetical protein